MDAKEMSPPIAIGIVVVVLLLAATVGYFYMGRKPAVSATEESKRSQFQKMYGGKH